MTATRNDPARAAVLAQSTSNSFPSRLARLAFRLEDEGRQADANLILLALDFIQEPEPEHEEQDHD